MAGTAWLRGFTCLAQRSRCRCRGRLWGHLSLQQNVQRWCRLMFACRLCVCAWSHTSMRMYMLRRFRLHLFRLLVQVYAEGSWDPFMLWASNKHWAVVRDSEISMRVQFGGFRLSEVLILLAMDITIALGLHIQLCTSTRCTVFSVCSRTLIFNTCPQEAFLKKL